MTTETQLYSNRFHHPHNPPTRFARLTVLTLVSLIVGFTPHLLRAQNVVVFTESSSTVLTETFNGTPVSNWINAGPNAWVEQFPFVPGSLFSGLLIWSEPQGEGNTVNYINAFSAPTLVFSDVTPFGNPAPYGAPLTAQVLDLNLNLVTAQVYFVDSGDEAQTVPDSSATWPLVGIVCISLVVFRRYISQHTVVQTADEDSQQIITDMTGALPAQLYRTLAHEPCL